MLSEPITEKETEVQKGKNGLEFGASAMQVSLSFPTPQHDARDDDM